MATERQIQANQRNAQLSTGPKTPEGRAKSARNHRIHGFSSRIAVLTEPEDQEIFGERVAGYLQQYGTGKNEDIFRAVAAVNAEFQYIYINRSRKAFCQFTRERAVDHLWGNQRLPDHPNDAYDLNTRLAGFAVMRDFAADSILLKMNRYEREQLRLFDRAIDKFRSEFERQTTKSGELPPETRDHVNQSIETFHRNSSGGSIPEDLSEISRCPSDSNAPLQRCVCANSRNQSNEADDQTQPLNAPETSPLSPASNGGVKEITTAEAPSPAPNLEPQPQPVPAPPNLTIHDSNPISDNPQSHQPPALCKTRPEIDSCPVCRHPQSQELRYLLDRPHDIHQISAAWQIPVLDLWRCRLHHIENPADFYDIIGVSVQKARLLDKTDIQPVVVIEDKTRPLGINIPIPEYQNAA